VGVESSNSGYGETLTFTAYWPGNVLLSRAYKTAIKTYLVSRVVVEAIKMVLGLVDIRVRRSSRTKSQPTIRAEFSTQSALSSSACPQSIAHRGVHNSLRGGRVHTPLSQNHQNYHNSDLILPHFSSITFLHLVRISLIRSRI
jgi:hypothetical protein